MSAGEKFSFCIFDILLPTNEADASNWLAEFEACGINKFKEQVHWNTNQHIFEYALKDFRRQLSVIESFIYEHIKNSNLAQNMIKALMELFSWFKRPSDDIKYVDGNWQYELLMDV